MSVLRFLLHSNTVSKRLCINELTRNLMSFIYQNMKRISGLSTSLIVGALAIVLELIGTHEQVLENENIMLLLVLAKEKDSSIRVLAFEILAKASLHKTCFLQIMAEYN